MVESSVADATSWHSDDKSRTVVFLTIEAIPVSDFGCLVDDLIESRINVVGELDLRYRPHPL